MAKSVILLFFSALLVMCILQFVNSIDCEACGKECKQICGTKRFRNCCFNYIKKRSGSSIASSSGLHYELMMVGPETSDYYPSFKNNPDDHEDVYRHKIYEEGIDKK